MHVQWIERGSADKVQLPGLQPPHREWEGTTAETAGGFGGHNR